MRDSVKEFIDDDCQTQAAALSYYTIFSLPPLMVLILLLLGAVLDPQDIRGHLEVQLGALMGASATEQIRNILEQAQAPGSSGVLPTVLSIIALALGATGAFGQLQAALNRAWEVAPDPDKGGLKSFILKRVFSFGMILSVAFLLLVSLVLSAALTAFGGALGSMLPDGVSATLLQVLNQVVSLVVITALFAALFKVLPDARVAWRDVWVGGAVTARAVRGRQVPHRPVSRPEQSGRGVRRRRLARRPAGVDLLLLHDPALRRGVHPALGGAAGRRDRAGARGGAGGAGEEAAPGGHAGRLTTRAASSPSRPAR